MVVTLLPQTILAGGDEKPIPKVYIASADGAVLVTPTDPYMEKGTPIVYIKRYFKNFADE